MSFCIRFPTPTIYKHQMRAMKDDLLALRYEYSLKDENVLIFFDIEEQSRKLVKGVVRIRFRPDASQKTMDDVGTSAYDILCMHSN